MFEEKLVVKVPSVEICENHTAIKFEKSPLKILIDKYENMRVENESVTILNEKCVNEKRDNSEYGQSEADVKGAKPNGSVCVMPGVSSAKPMEDVVKPSQAVGKVKKKVWGEKKNGLFGWKMVKVNKQPSSNIHTIKKTNAQPTSTLKDDSKSQQTIFKKWLGTEKRNVGVGGPKSDICVASISENTTKIMKKESLENIHPYGFNYPRPDSQYPAKTD
jgi:hypothetical protein